MKVNVQSLSEKFNDGARVRGHSNVNNVGVFEKSMRSAFVAALGDGRIPCG
jgi:hypothetical protein